MCVCTCTNTLHYVSMYASSPPRIWVTCIDVENHARSNRETYKYNVYTCVPAYNVYTCRQVKVNCVCSALRVYSEM